MTLTSRVDAGCASSTLCLGSADRRQALEYALKLLLVSFMLVSCCLLPASAKSTQPNVIIILADDLGYGDISANGSRIATPNIDALANMGVNFSSFYSSANVCTPSRAGLMTGRYPIRSGLAYGVISANDERGLPATEVTLAEQLQNAGYLTALIGKWHLGHRAEHWPTEHGFDSFFGLLYSNDQTPLSLYRGDQVVTDEVDQKRLTQQYTDEAQKIIEDSDGKPFFILMSHTFPHIPLFVPDEFSGKSKAGLYGDVVEHLDWSTGKILSALKESGQLENTLIVVTSDNGPWFEGSSGNSRGGKGSSWEGAYRVPFIASWPAAIKAKSSDAISMNIDILPTVLDATGVGLPKGVALDGRSLMPILTGNSDRSPHDYLLFFNNEEIVGVRDARWKLLTRNYYRKDYAALDKFYGDGYWLLWDMSDPTPERYSMANREPEALQQLRTVLNQAQKDFDPMRTRAPMQVRY